MRKLLILLLLTLNGCAAMQSRELPLACKIADVTTTIVALKTGAFHETNFLMNALMGGAHGFAPFLIVSAAYAGVIWFVNDKRVNVASSAITCPVAAHNLFLLVR